MLAGEDGGHAVLSPEQVALELPLAGPSSRMLAYFVDYLLVLVLQLGLFFTSALFESAASWLTDVFEGLAGVEGDPGVPWAATMGPFLVLMVAVFVAEMVYFVTAELVFGGRSVGKALVGLRVVRDGGLPIDLRSSLLRNLLRIADVLPAYYVVGLVAMLAGDNGKRLGDWVAGTVVVRLDRVPLALDPLLGDASERFRFDREQLARTGARERRLLLQTLRRIPTLDDAAARVVLARATEVLCSRIGYGEEIAEDDRQAFLRALGRATQRR